MDVTEDFSNKKQVPTIPASLDSAGHGGFTTVNVSKPASTSTSSKVVRKAFSSTESTASKRSKTSSWSAGPSSGGGWSKYISSSTSTWTPAADDSARSPAPVAKVKRTSSGSVWTKHTQPSASTAKCNLTEESLQIKENHTRRPHTNPCSAKATSFVSKDAGSLACPVPAYNSYSVLDSSVSLTNLTDQFHELIDTEACQSEQQSNALLRETWVHEFLTNYQPNFYENYRHGGANYWYNEHPPVHQTEHCFKVLDHRRPMVDHPHQATRFIPYYLGSAMKQQCSSNYMLPKSLFTKEGVFLNNNNAEVRVGPTRRDIRSYLKLTFNNFPEKYTVCTQYSVTATQFIFFHVKHWKRIPYDSEIDFFLKFCLGITQTNSKEFYYLTQRIHNSCVNLYHSLSLKRDVTPGKQSKWASKLSLKDKDIFHDPSVSFKPLPPPFKPRTVQRLQPSIHISARSTKSTSKDCIEDYGYCGPAKNQRDVHAIKHISFSINENSTQREKYLSDDDEKKPKARTAIVPTHVTEKKLFQSTLLSRW